MKSLKIKIINILLKYKFFIQLVALRLSNFFFFICKSFHLRKKFTFYILRYLLLKIHSLPSFLDCSFKLISQYQYQHPCNALNYALSFKLFFLRSYSKFPFQLLFSLISFRSLPFLPIQSSTFSCSTTFYKLLSFFFLTFLQPMPHIHLALYSKYIF